MTTVFIHGVPDTARVWSRLAALLPAGETKLLCLPGFGCDRPEGFGATKEDYVSWLIDALEAVPGRRDIIAHDWGSILLMRVLSVRPDLVQSWVGGGAPVTGDYTWHATARLWQTAGAGERAMERLTPAVAADMLAKAGLPEADAQETARAIDATMKACILALYRSGRDVFRAWEGDLARIEAPGLVLWGRDDPYASPSYGEAMLKATGAMALRVLDCGHWWQVERPQQSAAAILDFWRAAGL
jgi:pimeloyl-ACP methyl ester carboxylesterase